MTHTETALTDEAIAAVINHAQNPGWYRRVDGSRVWRAFDYDKFRAALAPLLTTTAEIDRVLRLYGDDPYQPVLLLVRDVDGDIIAHDLERPGCMIHGETEVEALSVLAEARSAYDELVDVEPSPDESIKEST